MISYIKKIANKALITNIILIITFTIYLMCTDIKNIQLYLQHKKMQKIFDGILITNDKDNRNLLIKQLNNIAKKDPFLYFQLAKFYNSINATNLAKEILSFLIMHNPDAINHPKTIDYWAEMLLCLDKEEIHDIPAMSNIANLIIQNHPEHPLALFILYKIADINKDIISQEKYLTQLAASSKDKEIVKFAKINLSKLK